MEVRNTRTIVFVLIIVFSLLYKISPAQCNLHQNSNVGNVHEIPVGLVLDMESLVGRLISSCISMAISDFYSQNSHYKTRIVLHSRNSKGQPLVFLSTALELLEHKKVQAIIGAEKSMEGKILAMAGDNAKVPTLSFASSPSSTIAYPYVIQITPDEAIQLQGIAHVARSFGWRNAILLYEDTDNGGEIIPSLVDAFQQENILISYKSAIPPLTTGDAQVLEELRKLRRVETSIFIVHLSPSLASRLFTIAKRLGMMSDGHAWIVTDRTMNFLHTMDAKAIESMEGVLGFKPYIPESDELRNFSVRYMNDYFTNNLGSISMKEPNVLGIWAYDAVWALAMAVESFKSGKLLLDEILQIKLKGLSGEFGLTNGKLNSKSYEIVNVVGKCQRRIGMWTLTDRMSKKSSFNRRLEAVIGPGGSTTAPKGWLNRISEKKLRIGVPVNKGFNELVQVTRDNQTNATTVTGFCIDVFNASIATLPYQVPYDFVPFEDEHGHSLGSYSDLIYQVYLKNFDAVVGDTTITANRSRYVDFTLPYTDLGVGTVARLENKDKWIFLKPLDRDLWLTSIAFFILTAIMVWLIERPYNNDFKGSPLESFFWFSFQGARLQSNLSKCIVTTWWLALFVLAASYTGTLASLLTVRQIQLASKGLKIGYQAGSSVPGSYVSNLNFKDDRLKLFSSTEEYADALSRGSNHGGVDAIVDEIPYIKIFLGQHSADFALISSDSTTNGFGFVFQKGSPLVPDISRAIARLREEGKIEMMEQKWFKRKASIIPQDSTTSPNALTLDNFGGLFLICGISLALVLLVFIINLLKAKVHFNYFIYKIIEGWRLAFMMRYFFLEM